MAWFFSDDTIFDDIIVLNKESSKHIIKSLRMKVGENLTVCDISKNQFDCEITNIDSDENKITCKVINSIKCENEPSVNITLYQALTKGDKMDYIIQKCVELGIHNIVPILTNRCVSRPDSKTLAKKQIRWQKISQGAAEQSRRGIIPKIETPSTLDKVIKDLSQYDKTVVFYECGGDKLQSIINKSDKNIAIFIGSEGGFEESEIKKLIENGAVCATLGKRILRAETAPIVSTSLIMYETDNF